MFSTVKVGDIVLGAGINYGHVMKVTQIENGFVHFESAAGVTAMSIASGKREIVASVGPLEYASLYSDATETVSYGGQVWQARRPESLAGHEYRVS